MLHESLGFEIDILAGLDGMVIPEHDSEQSKIRVSIEADNKPLICPRVTIYSDFDWYDADGLYVKINYASSAEQLHVWVPKPDASLLAKEDGWSFQIPGKNLQDPKTQGLVGWAYRIVNLKTRDCGLLFDCPDSKLDECMGSIVVSLKRRKISGVVSPDTTVAQGSPALNIAQTVCARHSLAVRSRGATGDIRHTLGLKSTEPFQMGNLILNPQPETAFQDLDAGVPRSNNWMRSCFLFRNREQLWKYIEGVKKPDPGKSHLAESRRASADLRAAIDQSTNATSSAIDPPRETRSKRIRESVEPRTPSREGSSKPSSVGHQAKKSKKKRTEADTPTTSRGTPRKPGTEVPVQKHKISRRNTVTESQEATEKPAPKAAVPKLKHLPQNTAAQGRIKKTAPQTATSVTDDPDAIHKEIGILREDKRRGEEQYQERIKPLEEQIEPLKEQIKQLEEQMKLLRNEHQERQDRITQQIQAKAAKYAQMVGR